MGFSGFPHDARFDGQALIPIRLAEIPGYGEKRNPGESEMLQIPPILKSLILTKTAQSPIP